MTDNKDTFPTLGGTYFYGGLDMDDTYASHLVDSMKTSGISNTFLGNSWPWRYSKSFPSISALIDASYGFMSLRRGRGSHKVDFSSFYQEADQFNFIGYSYGALIVCQIAQEIIDKTAHRIDNIVLIGAPISPNQLHRLRQENVFIMSIF